MVHYIKSTRRISGAVPTYHEFDSFRVEVRSRDHNPPHFHAVGPDFHALIGIRDLQIIRGEISRKAYAEVVAWASGREAELLDEWNRLNARD